MTKRKNMTAGQRQMVLEKKVEQMELATRISQMLLQQVGNSVSAMARDLGEMAHRQRDLQYMLMAMQELSGIDLTVVNKRAEELQVKDFNEVSDKEDQEKGYTVTDVVEEDSVVVVTTEAEDAKKSILRSKLVVSDLGLPKLKEDLLGKKPGDKFDADIGGMKHVVTLLAVRKKPAATETEGAGSDDKQDG
jgi:hypothetical protein